MKYDVVIIGTSHTIQKGGKDCSKDHAAEFTNFLLDKCHELNICGVAEELNFESLKLLESNASVLLNVANSLELPYRGCDPTNRQRADAGILNDFSVINRMLSQSNKGCNEESLKQLTDVESRELKRRLRFENEKRERWWLKKLVKLNVWPILFVCGSTHAEYFKSIVISDGRSAYVDVEDWKPIMTKSK